MSTLARRATDSDTGRGREAGRARRVLYVQRPRGGGSLESLYELVRALDPARYEPLVLLHEPGHAAARFERLGIRVLSPWSRRPGHPDDGSAAGTRGASTRLAWRIMRVIRAESIDLVHHNNNLRANRASIIAARLAGVPQVCHTRMLKRYSPWADRFVAELVDHFVFVSHAVRRQVVQQIGESWARGRVIHDPVDLDAYAAAAGGRGRLRREFGIGDDERLIVNPGRIVRWKGQAHFLRAMAHVVVAHPNARALIVGAPGARPPARAYDAELRRLADGLGLDDRVRFTGFRSDVPEILAAADVVVHSSCEPEPLGRVVLEAMAAARPVVATAAGGVLDLVADGETGLLVPLADPRRMADAIDRLLANPADAWRMGRRARDLAWRSHAPGPYAESIQRVYDSILSPFATRVRGRAPTESRV